MLRNRWHHKTQPIANYTRDSTLYSVLAVEKLQAGFLGILWYLSCRQGSNITPQSLWPVQSKLAIRNQKSLGWEDIPRDPDATNGDVEDIQNSVDTTTLEILDPLLAS